MSCEVFRLVEFPFRLLHGMQWDGHDEIPTTGAQRGFRLANQQPSQKRLEPQRARIFPAVNDVEHHAFRRHGGSRGRECQVELAAIGALEPI